jgi:hypothetical protein
MRRSTVLTLSIQLVLLALGDTARTECIFLMLTKVSKLTVIAVGMRMFPQ